MHRLGAKDMPYFDDSETTFAELKARLDRTLSKFRWFMFNSLLFLSLEGQAIETLSLTKILAESCLCHLVQDSPEYIPNMFTTQKCNFLIFYKQLSTKISVIC